MTLDQIETVKAHAEVILHTVKRINHGSMSRSYECDEAMKRWTLEDVHNVATFALEKANKMIAKKKRSGGW